MFEIKSGVKTRIPENLKIVNTCLLLMWLFVFYFDGRSAETCESQLAIHQCHVSTYKDQAR